MEKTWSSRDSLQTIHTLYMRWWVGQTLMSTLKSSMKLWSRQDILAKSAAALKHRTTKDTLTPPSRRFASRSPCRSSCSRATAAGCCRLGSVAVEVFPVEAVETLFIRNTCRNVRICLDHIMNDATNLVVSGSNTPLLILNGIVTSNTTGMTLSLHGITPKVHAEVAALQLPMKMGSAV